MAFEDDLLALERRIVKAAAGDWLGSIDELRRLLAMESPTLRSAVLALVAPQIEAAALAGLTEAAGMAAEHAADVARAGELSDEALAQVGQATTAPRTSQAAQDAVNGLDARAAMALQQARSLLDGGAEIEAVLASLFGNANETRRTLESSVNLASNEAIVDVADAAELPLVWIAERNACVACLAYSGQVARGGAPFPGGLTYGAKNYDKRETIPTPPKHGHCRCFLEPLWSEEYAEALRREADRSVLRGWSLENESMGVRVGAAERLIENGVDAPASVINFAERAIKNGEFPSRVVPSGNPRPPAPPVPPTPPPAPPRDFPTLPIAPLTPKRGGWTTTTAKATIAELSKTPEGKNLAKTLKSFQSGGATAIPRLRTDIEKYLEGGDLDPGRRASVENLLGAINASDAGDKQLWRGMVIPGSTDEALARYAPGTPVDLSLASFTSDKKTAVEFSTVSAGKRVQTKNNTAVVVELVGGSKNALPIENMSPSLVFSKEKEWLAAGRYEVVGSRASTKNGATTVHVQIRQVEKWRAR